MGVIEAMIEEEGEDDYPPPTPIEDEEDEDGIVRDGGTAEHRKEKIDSGHS